MVSARVIVFISHSSWFFLFRPKTDSWRGSDKCKNRNSAGIAAEASVAGKNIASAGLDTNDGLTGSLGIGGLAGDKLGEARGTKVIKEGGGGKVGVKLQAAATIGGCVGSGTR